MSNDKSNGFGLHKYSESFTTANEVEDGENEEVTNDESIRLNNMLYITKTLNPKHYSFNHKRAKIDEEEFEVPENIEVRKANFNMELMNLLYDVDMKELPSENDMDEVCKLVLKYRMNESTELFREVTLDVLKFYTGKERQFNELNINSNTGIKIMVCLTDAFLKTKGEDYKLSFPDSKSIKEIIKILKSARVRIYICVNQLTNKEIIKTLKNLHIKRKVKIKLITNELSLEAYSEFNNEDNEENNLNYRIRRKLCRKINNNFVLVDDTVLIGSFSWDDQDDSHASETEIVIKSSELADELKDDFKLIWRKNKKRYENLVNSSLKSYNSKFNQLYSKVTDRFIDHHFEKEEKKKRNGIFGGLLNALWK